MFVEAAGAVLVCGSLACAGAAVLRRRHQLAATLLAAALACAAADAFGAPGALHGVAAGLAVAGALAMVLGRLGRPLPLTWLDFVMGGCAVASLAVTTGAELPPIQPSRMSAFRDGGSTGPGSAGARGG